jgi:3'(2'), 5'-bisphosphate nucleotidase
MTPELILAIDACMKAGRTIARRDCRVPVLAGCGDDDAYAPDEAGMESHCLLTRVLSPSGLPVISPFSEPVPFEVRSSWHHFWLVSPLDSIDGFLDCSGEYTVSAALVEGHEPVLGVVYSPSRDELYFASRESGAFRIREASSAIADTTRLFRSRRRGLASVTRSCRILVSRSRNDEKMIRYMDDLGREYENIDVMAEEGAMKFCRVAAGEADMYPCFGSTLEWDTAAGHAILKAVDGNVTDIRTGRELTYNKPYLVNPCFVAQ